MGKQAIMNLSKRKAGAALATILGGLGLGAYAMSGSDAPKEEKLRSPLDDSPYFVPGELTVPRGVSQAGPFGIDNYDPNVNLY